MPACHEFMQNCLTKKILLYKIPISLGAIAQLVEHLHGMQGVSGRGLGHRPFTAVTGVRIPYGMPLIQPV